MKTLMSNLPVDPKIALNPKTNKPLVRGKNGRFVKTDITTNTNNDQQISTGTQLPPLPEDVKPTALLNQMPPGYTGTVNKELVPNAEEIYEEDAEKTKEIKERLAELEKTAEVQEIKGEVELPEIVKGAGVEQAGEDVPIDVPEEIKMPLPDETIYTVSHTNPLQQKTSESKTWWVYWCLRQLAKLHITLKKVHGKIIRQMINS